MKQYVYTSEHDAQQFKALQDWMELPNVERRVIAPKINNAYRYIFTNDDEKICISSNSYRTRVSFNSSWIGVDTYSLSYRKETKKFYRRKMNIKDSCNNDIDNEHLIKFIREFLGYNWFPEKTGIPLSKLPIRMLKKLFSGKYTKYSQLVKDVRTYWFGKDNNFPLKKMVNLSIKLTSSKFESLVRYLRLSSNIERDVDFVVVLLMDTSKIFPIQSPRPTKAIVNDTFNQAYQLKRKLNYSWSKSRFDEEHDHMTRELMNYEIGAVPDVEFELGPVEIPRLRVINSLRQVFEEGYTQCHCIYTNYRFPLQEKKYFAFAYEHNGERATLMTYDDGRVSQFYCKRNSRPSKEASDYIKKINFGLKAYVESEVKKLPPRPDDSLLSVFDADDEIDIQLEELQF
jgi:hypothetical protein